MTTFDSVILEVSDPTAAEAFYRPPAWTAT